MFCNTAKEISAFESAFADVPSAPPDPIMGIKQFFQADKRSEKVDLSVGVYLNEQGKAASLEVVQEAFRRLLEQGGQVAYLPIDGLASFNVEAQKLLFGAESELLRAKRVLTAQSLGGTGALRYGADFLKRYYPDSSIYISNPTWANHRAIFSRAGFDVKTYPYLDKKAYGVDFGAMCDALASLPPRSIVLLHASCHNPTGIDPDTKQWDEIIEILGKSQSIPFIDFAYQGFVHSCEEDAQVLRRFADAGLEFLVAQSFSKNFSLYCRRTGSLSIVTADEKETKRVLSQLKTDIRTNNSNSPYEGAATVSLILSDSELRSRWEVELAEIRDRIKGMRKTLVDLLNSRGLAGEFQHILAQKGMYSYSGLSKEQVLKLREKCGVYLVESGRMCVAALTPANIEHVADSIAKVVKGEI